MYYSKSNSQGLNVPRNYSGSAFRVIDESDRTHIVHADENEHNPDKENECLEEESKGSEQKAPSIPLLSSLFSSISVEDILLLGLIFVIHQENPNDNILLLLLILLLAK